jgi:cell division protein FtsW
MSEAINREVDVATGNEGVVRGDVLLLLFVAALSCFGLLMIQSATTLHADRRYHDAYRFVIRQMAGMGVGLGGVFVMLKMSIASLRRVALPVYLLTIVLLALVMTPLGHEVNGATRWIRLGSINFQPSEVAKLSLVLALSHFLASNEGRLKDLVGVAVPALGCMMVLVFLVVLQRDLGTTVIMLGITSALLFVAGLQLRYLVAGGVAGAFGLAYLILSEAYRRERMISFMNPFSDIEGSGYQVVQGWIALANGGVAGSGFATGVAQRGFLPEAHTDFIIAVIGEEFGMLGWILTVLLIVGLVWRCMVIAERSQDMFATLIAAGVGVLFGCQAIINVGVVAGLLPAKGLVLPFLSYGASAAVVNMLAVGLVYRISRETPRGAS